jgi:hypothetical protein
MPRRRQKKRLQKKKPNLLRLLQPKIRKRLHLYLSQQRKN